MVAKRAMMLVSCIMTVFEGMSFSSLRKLGGPLISYCLMKWNELGGGLDDGRRHTFYIRSWDHNDIVFLV